MMGDGHPGKCDCCGYRRGSVDGYLWTSAGAGAASLLPARDAGTVEVACALCDDCATRLRRLPATTGMVRARDLPDYRAKRSRQPRS